jgi:universal stress protein E
MKTRPILLVAAGPQQPTPAMQRAFDLAQRSEVPVHICMPCHDGLIERSARLVNPEIMRLARQQFIDERRAWLESVAERWIADGLQVTTEAAWSPAAHEAILASVFATDPALVIKDAGHDSLARRMLNATLDWKLLRYCPSPLLLVRERSEHLPRRILAAVDTSTPEHDRLNGLIVGEALKYGDLAVADVHVAHAFPYLPVHSRAFQTLERVYAEARQADVASFGSFAATRHVPEAFRHWIEGEAAAGLAELIKAQEVDLLVIGSSYRSSIERLFLGSTAEGVLFEMPCDVLLVKPPEFRAGFSQDFDLRMIAQRAMHAGEH